MAPVSLRCAFHLLLLASVVCAKIVPRSVDPSAVDPHVDTQDAAPHEPHPPVPKVHSDARVNPDPHYDGSTDQIQCSTDDDCVRTILGPDSICHGIYCTCNDESYLSANSHKCLRETTNVGAGCEEDMQCKKRLGDAVKCDGHQCACVKDAKLIKGQCWNQIHLTNQCKRNEECMGGEDSSCVDGICVCNTGKVNDPTNTKCLPKAHRIDDPCEEVIQCTENLGDGSTCKNSKCQCIEGYHFKSNICMKNLILGERCGNNIEAECFLQHSFGIDHVECDEVCKCKGDLVPSSDNQKCYNKDSGDDGEGGGAASLQPVLTTLITIVLARLFSS